MEPANVIPTIDLDIFEQGPNHVKAKIAQDVFLACRKYGFFQLINHGVDISLQKEMFEAAKDFFNLPNDIKDGLSIENSAKKRGYSGIAMQQLDPAAYPDYKESVYISEDSGEAQNQFPPDDLVPDFKTITSLYYNTMIGLGARVFRLLARSLDIEGSWFDHYTGADGTDSGWRGSTLRLVHYPPRPQGVGEEHIGCGAHTDFGSITFLLQDQVSGLEIKDPNGQGWISIPPRPDVYVVNIGDLFQTWTCGQYKSAVHRVSSKQNVDRYSIPFFFNGNHDFIVEPITASPHLDDKPNSHFKPFKVGDHIMKRLRETHVELKSKS